MNKIWLIVKREYLIKIRNKSFLVMTFVMPLAVIFISFLIGFLTSLNNEKVREIFVLDTTSLFSESFKNTSRMQYQYFSQGSLIDLKKQAQQENAYCLLYIQQKENSQNPFSVKLFSQDSPSVNIINEITSDLRKSVLNQALKERNINPKEIEALQKNLDIQVENYSGEKSSNLASVIKFIFGGLAGYLLMMFIIIYGNMIMRSVIEEKTNRVVEIIISSVKPIQLMLGKIIGTALVGISQVLMWLIIGGILMTFLTTFLGVSPSDTPPIPNMESGVNQMISDFLIEFFKFPIMKLIISFFIFFIGGYLLYSSLYTAIGAAVDNETDTQQFLFPVMLPLILAIYIGGFTLSDDPHGQVSVVFSYIPFTSSITMLMRIPFGVSWSEILTSAVLLYATFFFVLWISSKIYHIGILIHGKKVSYKDLYKWLRQ